MCWQDKIYEYPVNLPVCLNVQQIMADVYYFYSDTCMSNSTHTVVHYDERWQFMFTEEDLT